MGELGWRAAQAPRGRTFVSTPIVRSPIGSYSFTSRIASEVAISAFAGETARMMTFSDLMYARLMSSSSLTMLWGWPSVAILVRPGMSTSVRLGT